MKSVISLVALAATCATAIPASRQSFTLTTKSNDPSLNNIALVDARNSENTIGTLETIPSKKESPTVFFLEAGTKGRLVTKSTTDNSLRYAWGWEPSDVGSIQFDKIGGADGTIYYPKFTITSDNLLVPGGNYSGIGWSFCSPDSDFVAADTNLGGPIFLGQDGCTALQGLNVVASD
ncbi:hypothetical protein BGW36DRAFT_431771 [Talaromyces proteolyticus]|uniref:Cell wall protein PhiA n=1 Tax=Talaromyces proteolyticus TaxID=1131652 RepID=A0AAD4KG06_9EURO|nr:uncharacterized protein BGW36DRAFT_431771 [Talaromyces proteolyticus]KAH8691214.1 hypothetical protein BGW36DRAFT_431771 [Talaromyces proteolyticus]